MKKRINCGSILNLSNTITFTPTKWNMDMTIPTQARIIAYGILIFDAKNDAANKDPKKTGMRYCELTKYSVKISFIYTPFGLVCTNSCTW